MKNYILFFRTGDCVFAERLIFIAKSKNWQKWLKSKHCRKYTKVGKMAIKKIIKKNWRNVEKKSLNIKKATFFLLKFP